MAQTHGVWFGAGITNDQVTPIGTFISLREKPRPSGRGGIAQHAKRAPVPDASSVVGVNPIQKSPLLCKAEVSPVECVVMVFGLEPE